MKWATLFFEPLIYMIFEMGEGSYEMNMVSAWQTWINIEHHKINFKEIEMALFKCEKSPTISIVEYLKWDEAGVKWMR